MVAIAVNPFVMRDCTFTVAADNYEAHLSGVEFVPSSSSVQFKGLTPTSVHNFAGSSTWLANLAFAQDWSTADSLSRYLHEHEGEKVEVVFAPRNGGPSITATISVVPGSIGGQVDQVAAATVSCPVDGKPVLAPVV